VISEVELELAFLKTEQTAKVLPTLDVHHSSDDVVFADANYKPIVINKMALLDLCPIALRLRLRWVIAA
jgi:hypothetical protein